jgi:putative PIN family toxin of toxin-antitoxin system
VDRLVIDTGILVSGTVNANTPPSQVVDLWKNGAIVLVTSPHLLAEAKDVFTRPKIIALTGLSTEETHTYLQEMARRSYVTKGKYQIESILLDPNDMIVLQAAIEGSATHIVSGDKDLLILKEFRGIPIMTARNYLSHYQK